jgi:hypothetical protein
LLPSQREEDTLMQSRFGRSAHLPLALGLLLAAPPALAGAKPALAGAKPAPGRGGLFGVGEILIGGKRIARMARRPQQLTAAQQAAFNTFYTASLALPPLPGFTNWRSAAVANEAATSSTPVSGTPLGKMVVFMPGLGNWGPSAATVFRLARYAQRVVMAYQATANPKLNSLRVATQIDGVPVPESLRGRVLAIGDGSNRALVTPQQGSDLMLEYLSLMQRNQSLLGFDPITSNATFIGHSEGSFIMMITRERLELAGFKQTVGRFITFAGGLGPYTGGPYVPFTLLSVYKWLSEKLGKPSDLVDYMNFLEKHVLKSHNQNCARKVDLAVAAQIGPPLKVKLVPPEIENLNNIRPGMRLAALSQGFSDAFSNPSFKWSLEALRDLGKASYLKSDGLVPLEVASCGKKVLVLSKPHDHGGMAEDPAVVDEVVAALK